MQVEGITWHGVTLDPHQFAAMKKLCSEVLGLTRMLEQDGWTLFAMPNGTVLDLFEPNSEMIPTYGLNDAIVFGFRVDDIEAAATELQAAGMGSCAMFSASQIAAPGEAGARTVRSELLGDCLRERLERHATSLSGRRDDDSGDVLAGSELDLRLPGAGCLVGDPPDAGDLPRTAPDESLLQVAHGSPEHSRVRVDVDRYL
jgi:hypothetical protein